MRRELFYNPLALAQRIGEWAETRRRLLRLKGSAAAGLCDGHIDSLELLELLRPASPGVIYDIGANVGTWTLLAKAVFPAAEIHAFEPLPQHTLKFRASIDGLKGIYLHEVALGPEGIAAQMHVNDPSDTSSILELSPRGIREWNLAKIDAVPLTLHGLDQFCSAHRVRPPDLIKLDVQGFELEVLKSAEQTLSHTRAVLAEVSFRDFYCGQCRFDDVVSFLAARQMLVVAFGARTPRGQLLSQTDVLFMRPG